MTSSSWETHTIPKKIIPTNFDGKLKPEYWGKETNLTVVSKIIGVELFKKILSHISPDKTILIQLPEADDVTPSNLVTHYIEYNINDTYEITRHHDGCSLTIIIYIYKDTDVKDEFYIDGEAYNEDRWNKNNDSYKVLSFNGYIEHWGKLTGKGERKVLVFHYD